MGPNDIVFDKEGGMWFTDHGKSYDRLMDRGALFYARCDGSLIKEAVFPMITPNGVGLSPDGETLYATETETGRLWAWPIIGPGELAKEPWPSPAGGSFIGGPTGYQRFDSLAVEAAGNICVASLVAGGISVFCAGGRPCRVPSSARALLHQHCFWRAGYAHSVYHPVGLWPAGGGPMVKAGPGAQRSADRAGVGHSGPTPPLLPAERRAVTSYPESPAAARSFP